MTIYNDKKVCFIICTNNEQYLSECLLYLNMLEVPEDYEIDVLTIEGAKSMAAGYNEAMNSSDAKYKVYIHQDTFICDRHFITKLLNVFSQDEKIGIVGTIGSKNLPKDGVMWHGKRVGNFYRLDEIKKRRTVNIEKVVNGYEEVEVVDGLLIATSVDIPWREDILTGWDFYDVSHCLEMQRYGYKVVVPKQEEPWVIHDCGVPSYWNYNKYREIVLQEYEEVFSKKTNLRVLFVHSVNIRLAGLLGALMELGCDVTEMPHRVESLAILEKDENILEEFLEEGHYDLVVTYDFVRVISKVCQKMNVKYYAWVYDSPLLGLYTEEAKNQVNYITVFEKNQYNRLINQGLKNLKCIPLATEVNLFGAINITKEDEKEYSADVSFVGSLYDKRGFEEMFEGTPEELLAEAQEIILAPNCQWNGENKLFGAASDELISYMVSKEDASYLELFDIDKRYYCESMRLVRKCNEIERITILNEIAKKYQLTLYTKNVEQKDLVNVDIRPWVNYLLEMPKVFSLSKINLNISSRSIESGIPQRVWDILAVGGFCLTNYQPELEEYFEIGKDLDVYHDLDELMKKIEFYLKNEESRIRIAINGYKKVRKYHTYSARLTEILKWIEEE